MEKYDGQAGPAIVFSHIVFYTVEGLRNPTACKQMQYSKQTYPSVFCFVQNCNHIKA